MHIDEVDVSHMAKKIVKDTINLKEYIEKNRTLDIKEIEYINQDLDLDLIHDDYEYNISIKAKDFIKVLGDFNPENYISISFDFNQEELVAIVIFDREETDKEFAERVKSFKAREFRNNMHPDLVERLKTERKEKQSKLALTKKAEKMKMELNALLEKIDGM